MKRLIVLLTFLCVPMAAQIAIPRPPVTLMQLTKQSCAQQQWIYTMFNATCQPKIGVLIDHPTNNDGVVGFLVTLHCKDSSGDAILHTMYAYLSQSVQMAGTDWWVVDDIQVISIDVVPLLAGSGSYTRDFN